MVIGRVSFLCGFGLFSGGELTPNNLSCSPSAGWSSTERAVRGLTYPYQHSLVDGECQSGYHLSPKSQALFILFSAELLEVVSSILLFLLYSKSYETYTFF